ncbi:hypothetical protein B0H17DRAFT_1073992 [Mycena rosella]|uniref:Uncharacterized protein n=1 Tax=Mycena rosella TaxID=1033263 RepID=A0AAD7D7Y7_MYCRO|nr:hypothetical protein B0H17DRAFT_1073992 [Mycena rosella]
MHTQKKTQIQRYPISSPPCNRFPLPQYRRFPNPRCGDTSNYHHPPETDTTETEIKTLPLPKILQPMPLLHELRGPQRLELCARARVRTLRVAHELRPLGACGEGAPARPTIHRVPARLVQQRQVADPQLVLALCSRRRVRVRGGEEPRGRRGGVRGGVLERGEEPRRRVFAGGVFAGGYCRRRRARSRDGPRPRGVGGVLPVRERGQTPRRP